MADTGDGKIFIRLPALGPLIGASALESETASARLWAKADDSYGSPPLRAITVQWDSSTNAPVPGTLQLWPVQPVALPETEGPEQQTHYFALANIDYPAGKQRAVRMAFLHFHHAKEDPPTKAIDGTCADGVNKLVAMISSTQALATPSVNQDAAVGEVIRKEFADLERHLESRRERGAKPIPDTLSRRYRRVGSISDCEAVLPAKAASKSLRFAATSCRHPGVQFDRELAERALEALGHHVCTSSPPEFVVMLGDQIYADATAGVIDVGELLEKYTVRYDEAFGSRAFRRVASRLPAYMLADDHEIRDSWPNDAVSNSKGEHWTQPAKWAWLLYYMHQQWHDPLGHTRPVPKFGERLPLWYQFEDCGVPFFAFDTRFDRKPYRMDGSDRIVDEGQMRAFKEWLVDVRKREEEKAIPRHVPKFVMASSVYLPGLTEFESEDRLRHADNWQAFGTERADIARSIVASGLHNVVLLSGDYHCAAVARLNFMSDGAQARGYAIVAPPLYAPFPFANVRKHEVACAGGVRDPAGVDLAQCAGEAIETQGYALVSVDQVASEGRPDDWQIAVDIFHQGDNGKPDRRATATLSAAAPPKWTKF